MALNFHEDLNRSTDVGGSSDRNFGLVFAAFFAAVSLWPLHVGGRLRWPPLAMAGVFLIVALVRPAWLRLLNKGWTMLGLLLGRIVNPIVTAILFFLIFVPAGVLFRLLGKDPLRLKPMPELSTYWIARTPPGPLPVTMSKLF